MIMADAPVVGDEKSLRQQLEHLARMSNVGSPRGTAAHGRTFSTYPSSDLFKAVRDGQAMLPSLWLKDTPNAPVVATSGLNDLPGFYDLPEDAQSELLAAMMKSNPEEACRTLQALRKAGFNPSEDFWGNVAYLAGLKKSEKGATFRELVTRFCEVGRYEEPLKRYFAAAKFGYIDVLWRMEKEHPKELELEPDPNPNPMSLTANQWKPNNSMHRALIVAASWAQLDTMDYLMRRIMEVGKTPGFLIVARPRDYIEAGVFEAAAGSGSVDALEWCLKNGANRDMYPNAAGAAAVPKVIDAVQWFEKKGWDYSGMADSAFYTAASNGSIINMEYFYSLSQKSGREVDFTRAFVNAATTGQVQAMKWIDKKNMDTNKTPLSKLVWQGALHQAAIKGRIDALKYAYPMVRKNAVKNADVVDILDEAATEIVRGVDFKNEPKNSGYTFQEFTKHGLRSSKAYDAGLRECFAFLEEQVRELGGRTQW